MKNVICITIGVIIILAGCSKSRTCSCTAKEHRTETRTPKSGGAATTVTTDETSQQSFTHDKIKKQDMRKYYGCYDRSETSSDTYTTTVPVQTVQTIGGTQFTTTVYVEGTVKNDYKYDYDCELK